MSGIYFDPARAHLASFASSTKGRESIIRLEIRTSDPYQMATILEQCQDIDAERKAGARTPAVPRARAAKTEGQS